MITEIIPATLDRTPDMDAMVSFRGMYRSRFPGTSPTASVPGHSGIADAPYAWLPA